MAVLKSASAITNPLSSSKTRCCRSHTGEVPKLDASVVPIGKRGSSNAASHVHAVSLANGNDYALKDGRGTRHEGIAAGERTFAPCVPMDNRDIVAVSQKTGRAVTWKRAGSRSRIPAPRSPARIMETLLRLSGCAGGACRARPFLAVCLEPRKLPHCPRWPMCPRPPTQCRIG